MLSATARYDNIAQERRDDARERVGNPLAWIAGTIVECAAADWRRIGHLRSLPSRRNESAKRAFRLAKKAGFASPRDQLIDFFNGAYFRELCAIVSEDIDADKIAAHLEIPQDVEPVRVEQQLKLGV